jgi:hypothetical protein
VILRWHSCGGEKNVSLEASHIVKIEVFLRDQIMNGTI